MNAIAGHFAITDEISAAATAVVPLNCSGGLNSVIRRSDNRMYFARQGSSSQACFMRQASTDQAKFPFKSNASANEVSNSCSEAPLFSRPTKVEPAYKSCVAPDSPKFARPIKEIGGQSQSQPTKKSISFQSNGLEWSPKMDVAETRCRYIIALELPGVSHNDDLRVEVYNKMLRVRGRKLTQKWRAASLRDDVLAYHKREILQGQYHITWLLPANANKDRVSAELVDGLLQIIIPKL